MIRLHYDEETGIVSSKVSGLVTVTEIQVAWAKIRALMDQARRQVGFALYLVDARESVVQPREVIDEIEKMGSFLLHPNDKMAVIVPNNLTKMQTQRVYTSQREQAFLTLEEARTWLLAH